MRRTQGDCRRSDHPALFPLHLRQCRLQPSALSGVEHAPADLFDRTTRLRCSPPRNGGRASLSVCAFAYHTVMLISPSLLFWRCSRRFRPRASRPTRCRSHRRAHTRPHFALLSALPPITHPLRGASRSRTCVPAAATAPTLALAATAAPMPMVEPLPHGDAAFLPPALHLHIRVFASAQAPPASNPLRRRMHLLQRAASRSFTTAESSTRNGDVEDGEDEFELGSEGEGDNAQSPPTSFEAEYDDEEAGSGASNYRGCSLGPSTTPPAPAARPARVTPPQFPSPPSARTAPPAPNPPSAPSSLPSSSSASSCPSSASPSCARWPPSPLRPRPHPSPISWFSTSLFGLAIALRPLRELVSRVISHTSALHSRVHAHSARSSASRDKNDDAESTQAQLAALRAQVARLELAVAQLAAPDREDALAPLEKGVRRVERRVGCARGGRSSRGRPRPIRARPRVRVAAVRVKARRYSSPLKPKFPHTTAFALVSSWFGGSPAQPPPPPHTTYVPPPLSPTNGSGAGKRRALDSIPEEGVDVALHVLHHPRHTHPTYTPAHARAPADAYVGVGGTLLPLLRAWLAACVALAVYPLYVVLKPVRAIGRMVGAGLGVGR
ncbi:hypothetical protein B0H14DRAFT_3531062 [Mycena olivaceomarginata]|nr:hypothetical protein B0H14DRAFT_3531062 [Mycena olivaceomarginata]